jgi:ABC-2 type transport system ATP-binding protein
VESLRERSLRHVTVTFEEDVDPGELSTLDGVGLIAAENRVLRLSAPETAMDGLVKALARHRVRDLVAEPADLEEIFLELYRETDDGR